MDDLLHDLRYAVRTALRQPLFTLTALAALALGIGANTAVFSVVYAVLLQPLPFAHPSQLIYAHDTFPSVRQASVSWPKFMALRDGNRSLSGLAAVAAAPLTITGHGEPQRVAGMRVSGDFFSVLGVAPAYGRLLGRADDVPHGGKVVALSYGLWAQRFGGDPRVVGQAVSVNDETYTVAGVMPPAFNYPAGTDAWVPLALPDKFQGNNFLRLIGRMKPGVTLPQATDDLRAVGKVFSDANKLQRDVAVYSLQQFLTAGNRQTLLILQGTVAFVLLIACANVANLLLARSVTRTRELSIRGALGAGRGRVFRQLLTESVTLALVGSVLGVILASWLLRLFVALAPANYFGVRGVQIDLGVLTATLLVAILTGVLFGLAPARQGFRVDPNRGLRDTGTRGATSGAATGASRALVVAEIALAMVLVVGAGLMVKSLIRMEGQDPGFRPDGVLSFQLTLPPARYATNDRVIQTYGRILGDVRGIPGVQSAGAINMLPLQAFGFNGGFQIVGRPPFQQQDRAPVLEFRFVTPGYFTAMGIPILEGRDIGERDTATSKAVCLINDRMAAQFWPKGNPVGEQLNFGPGPGNQPEIVGVVGDTRSLSLANAPVIESYFPLPQAPVNSLTLVIRTENQESLRVLPAIRQRLAQIDGDVPIVKPQPLESIVETSAGGRRLMSVLTTVFAALAGLLAAVGIYSVIAYSVAQRMRELGIRVALGADRRAVVRLIVGEGLVLAGVGILAGLAGAAVLTGTLKTLLFEVSPLDPAVLAAASAGVILVTALASYIPARRALRIDPMHALRAD